MKWFLGLFGAALVVVAICLCGNFKRENNDDYLRIHIVANSNKACDQNAKYVVKDAIVEFLIPYLSEAETMEQAQEIVESNLEKIGEVANAALRSEGLGYEAKVSIKKENIPTRAYGNFVLEEGVYQSLNIKLGEAKGDNWWCVVFPAVCFLDTRNYENVEYISKILDIISSVI